MQQVEEILAQLSKTIVQLDSTIDRMSEELDEEKFVLKSAPLLQRRDKLQQQFRAIMRQSLQDWQHNQEQLLQDVGNVNRQLSEALERLNADISKVDDIADILEYADMLIRLAAMIAV